MKQLICNENGPVFSIIIPTHNRANLLCRAIDSVLAQCFTSYEILVINDGSTECYDEVISKHASHIKYYTAALPEGVAKARNTGITAANGQWTVFLDDDDELENNYLSNAYEFIITNNLKFSFIWCSIKTYKYDSDVNITDISYLHYKFCVELSNNMIHKALTIGASYGLIIDKNVYKTVGLFDTNYEVAEDTDFVVRMLKNAVSPVSLGTVGIIKHNYFNGGLSFNYEKYSRNEVYEKIISAHRDFFDKYPMAYKKFVTWAVIVHYRNGRFEAGDKLAADFTRLWPPSILSIARFLSVKLIRAIYKYHLSGIEKS